MSETETVTPRFKKSNTTLDLPTIMNQAREQYTAEREKVLAERKSFDDRLAEIDGELDKIESYFNPHKAVLAPAPKQTRTSTGSRGPRRTGVRDDVLAKITEQKDGISRKDLLTAMNATEKKHEQSVSNAVAALTKTGKISGEKGHYKAV